MTLLVVCTPPSIYHIVNIKFIQRTLQLKQSTKITAVQKQEQTCRLKDMKTVYQDENNVVLDENIIE